MSSQERTQTPQFEEKKITVFGRRNGHAQTDCDDKDGRLALTIACAFGPADIVRDLLDERAQINGMSYHTAVKVSEKERLTARRIIMQRLIKEGSDIEAWYSDGQTPLFKAVVLGNPRMAKLLLDHKAKPDHVDNQRAMPLEYAVALGNCPSNSSRDSGTFDIPGVVDVLLKSNPDMLIARNKLQLTPTGVAISCGNSEMAKLLLQYPGGDIEQGVLRMLPLCHAALKANEAMIDVFLQGGVSLKGTDGRFGRNALSWAISQGNKAAFTRLLQIPRFRWDDVDRMGRTPWTLLAVVEGHTTFFEELRSRDSDVHRPDRFGLTLFAAAQHGYCRIVWQILKNSPLKHKPKDRFGRSLTCLDFLNVQFPPQHHCLATINIETQSTAMSSIISSDGALATLYAGNGYRGEDSPLMLRSDLYEKVINGGMNSAPALLAFLCVWAIWKPPQFLSTGTKNGDLKLDIIALLILGMANFSQAFLNFTVSRRSGRWIMGRGLDSITILDAVFTVLDWSAAVFKIRLA
ncbi:ankyrin repeat domain-containing protein [Aspergillus affinis]|uniref:ankyrin repeat domain-containing protein n=1 Tax=Aspergillus affinis TaxID=1070780 RepID=UPI0022FE7F40|nr:uncharacterized protein KD926_010171 [Aspergillus affinis]KAI9038838.1 hypothetical protein KD926_010171 [Aspergillus affinis]